MSIKKNYQIKTFLSTKLGIKITNRLMKDGKKNKAEKIILDTLNLLAESASENPIIILKSAIKHTKPLIEVRTIRVRGTNYQVPIPIFSKRRTSLAIKWIIENARKKKGNAMRFKLRDELLLASKNQGESVKKKISVHKLASANRAYTHFRWF
jgi:small subunit ribosomal protein S7